MSGHLHRVKLVKEAFDIDTLAEICMADEGFFEKYGTEFKAEKGKGKFAFYFKDNDADILAIAHMDSVQKKKDFGVAKYVNGREVILSPTLDDRLGCYVICELLPKLGIKTDILLTTDEESGNSTARLFQTDKKYKWMFQFDRAGTDVVMYQYKTDEAFKKLEAVGFKTAYGSASDISKLGDLGCLGFNFGVGYDDYHYERAFADLVDVIDQVARFLKFHKVHAREHMAYDKKITSSIHTYTTSFGGRTEVWTPHQTTDYENDYGRWVDRNWIPKTIWNEQLQMYVVNQRLYRIAPDSRPVTDEELLRINSKWSNEKQRMVVVGDHTEAELLTQGRLSLEAADPKDPIERDESTFGEHFGVDLDEPCMCGHSSFVHHRRAVVQRTTTVFNACDFWKCNCKGFLSAHPKTLRNLGPN